MYDIVRLELSVLDSGAFHEDPAWRHDSGNVLHTANSAVLINTVCLFINNAIKATYSSGQDERGGVRAKDSNLRMLHSHNRRIRYALNV